MPLEVIGIVALFAAWLPAFCLLVFIRKAGWGGEVIIPASFCIAAAFAFPYMNNAAKERAIEEQQHQAIERGYALYCPRSGEFAWVGECEQKGEE